MTTNFMKAAGPCAVESAEQVRACAAMVKRAGATMLRGGAYKPRTNPDAFQGLGALGFRLLAEAARAEGLLSVSEVMEPSHVAEAVEAGIDVLQIGARNALCYPLLIAAGRSRRPVLLKRGMGSTIAETAAAAGYVTRGGSRVILCERGIRTFETATRNTLDVAAVPVLQQEGFEVWVDPSHAAGKRELVFDLAMAGVAAGADGLIVEAQVKPDQALTDARQCVDEETLGRLFVRAGMVRVALGRFDDVDAKSWFDGGSWEGRTT